MQPADYARALRRGLALVLLCGLLGVAGAALRLSGTTPQYEATSTLLFSVSAAGTVNELQQGDTYAEGLVQTYAELARERYVLEPVVEELDLDVSARALARRVSTEVALDTELLRVTVRDTDAARAAATANGITTTIVSAAEANAPVLPGSEPRDAEGNRLLDEDGNPLPPEKNLEVRSVGAATQPEDPVSPSPERDLALGLLAGLALGVGLALARALWRETVQDESDAVAAGVPLLGVLPRDRRGASSRPGPHGAWGGAVLGLRTGVLAASDLPADRTLLITSAAPGEGRTTVAAHLAASLADGGLPTLLVDADLRTAGSTRLLGLEGAEGLTDVLPDPLRAVTALAAPRGQAHPLRVLPVGRTAADPVAALGGPQLPRLLAELARGFAVVVVDGASLSAPDAVVLAQACGSTVLVARYRGTTRRALTAAVRRLERAGRAPAGLVLDAVPARRAGWRAAPAARAEQPAPEAARSP